MIKMKSVKLGLIGLGYIGKVHLQNCLRIKSVDLVAVSDVSKKALNLAKKMGVKNTFKDYNQLLKDPTIDAVIISLPTYLHASSAVAAAEACKDVLLEKPLARNVTEGKEIVSIANKNDVKLMVGYDLRFSSSFRGLKEKMNNGVLGDVQIAYSTNIASGPFFHRSEGSIPRPVPAWWFDKNFTGGGALMDLGSHLINLLRWYFGEIIDIRSYLGYRFNLGIEDQATCIAKFASGTIAIINTGWFSMDFQVKVEVLGTVKHALASHPPSQENRIVTATRLLLTKTSEYHQPHFRELEYFIHCVGNDLQPCTSGIDGLRDLEAITSAYENQLPLTGEHSETMESCHQGS